MNFEDLSKLAHALRHFVYQYEYKCHIHNNGPTHRLHDLHARYSLLQSNPGTPRQGMEGTFDLYLRECIF